MAVGFSYRNYSCVENSSQSIQHPPLQPPPVETFQIQSTEPLWFTVKPPSSSLKNPRNSAVLPLKN
ncbi:hypothetical protein GBA52_009035 [Prunus armeniaca]|nr:hypothetical protein GBA52_009035 [Prunus armeniaca]